LATVQEIEGYPVDKCIAILRENVNDLEKALNDDALEDAWGIADDLIGTADNIQKEVDRLLQEKDK